MTKKILHGEVERLQEELSRASASLITKAQDSHDLENVLNAAVLSLYQAQPDGQKNYRDETKELGRVWLSRTNNERGNGNMNIEYTPSREISGKWKYAQKTIGILNLRERTYSVDWSETYSENWDQVPDWHQIPVAVMKDTEKVMECLGLTRKQKE